MTKEIDKNEIAMAILKELDISRYCKVEICCREPEWKGIEYEVPMCYSIESSLGGEHIAYFCFGAESIQTIEDEGRVAWILEDIENYTDGGDECDTERTMYYLNIGFHTEFFTEELLDSLKDRKPVLALFHSERFDIEAVVRSTDGCPDERQSEVPGYPGWYYTYNRDVE